MNKDLADDKSIIYLNSQGLTIKGYADAKQGQILVKDSTKGLAWIDPVNMTQLNEAVEHAAEKATQAGEYSTQAGNAATRAEIAAGNADRINQQTMNWVNNKFW